MDRVTLRNMIVNNAEQLMAHPIIWNAMSADQQKLTKISLQAAQQENNQVVDAYLDYICLLWDQSP